jgi:hypothetical protein
MIINRKHYCIPRIGVLNFANQPIMQHPAYPAAVYVCIWRSLKLKNAWRFLILTMLKKEKHNSKSFIHSWMALQPFVGSWPLLHFRNDFYTDGRTPWMSDQPLEGRYLHTGQHKHRINANKDINTLSGIRTHDRRARASEDSSCLGPCGLRDRPI